MAFSTTNHIARNVIQIHITIYCSDQNSYNMITMYYIAITVFEYRYNCIELDNDWENVNGSKCGLLIMVNCVY